MTEIWMMIVLMTFQNGMGFNTKPITFKEESSCAKFMERSKELTEKYILAPDKSPAPMMFSTLHAYSITCNRLTIIERGNSGGGNDSNDSGQGSEDERST